jgi:fluoroacetyl-CoA thioesterase
MADGIRAGLTGEREVEVVESQTIASLKAGLPAVYGTPAMIMLMEMAAAEALEPHLPPGHISVGVEVNIRHLAATPLGDRVTAKAEVIEVNNNLVKFTVEARDTRQLIGAGTHTRAVVEVERFLRGLKRDSK